LMTSFACAPVSCNAVQYHFLQSPIVTPIIQCALLACALDHKDANLSVMKFFYSLLNCGRAHEHRRHQQQQQTTNDNNDAATLMKKHLVHQILQTHGSALVVNLMQASVFHLHTYMLSDVADVLLEIKEIDAQELGEHLRTALESLPKKNSGGAVTATAAQLDEFHTFLLRSETSKAINHALKDFTRLYK